MAQAVAAGSSTQEVRTAIDAEIEGRTLLDVLGDTVRRHAGAPALTWPEDGGWKTLSWSAYTERAREVAAGLRAMGVGRGDRVAIHATNRPEHLIADVAALYLGATPVSVYLTLAPDQIAHVAGDAAVRVAIVESADLLQRWTKVRAELPALEAFVLLDGEVPDGEVPDGETPDVRTWAELARQGHDARRDDGDVAPAAEPDDAATIIYTSGTTGPPKGVVLTHRNLLWEMASVRRVVEIPERTKMVSYLPLAHVAERTFSHYSALRYACDVHLIRDPAQLLEAVQRARPWTFLGVPRVWEKIRTGLEAKLAEAPEPRRTLAQRAIAVSRDAARRRLAGESVPPHVAALAAVADKVVLSKIRGQLGMDRLRFAISGAAALPEDVAVFFAAIGLPLHEAYGMTETTAATHLTPLGKPKLARVGAPLPGVEVKIADDGEICARGGNLTPGYLDRPDATAELIDADGWLHTGDLGSADDDGSLAITGRKKELIITAGGKNIAPTAIEALLKEHGLVGQALAYGDARPYITALLVLDPDAAPAWADKLGVAFGDLATFAADEAVHAEVQRAVDAANARLSRVEQVKRWTLLPTDWTAESGELTPSMKLRRSVVHDRFEAQIADLYT